ncbi:MAG: FAD-dependent oxidoreductase [Phycisphaera sp.]|nr:FAD-dependent oxidoreductase [Phycisphaera sp.]
MESEHRSIAQELGLPESVWPLLERARTLASGLRRDGAKPLVYWAHHALRTDENPALELACALAEVHGLPLLVYGQLAGTHPFPSDRHATFMLEGFRDFAAQLAELRIPFAFDATLPTDHEARLRALVDGAAALVTEDMPTEPFASWVDSLAARAPCAVIAVDTACTVPMNAVRGLHARAFSFSDATKEERLRRLAAPWRGAPLAVRDWPRIEHGLPEIDWPTLDISRLVASLEIDHSVAPVVDTRGGSSEGLARWSAFRATRLADYARDRNDAAVPAVSRMSAYLHYGMVSPMRIAREAHAAGAEKFVDELCVWRELAYHWCRHAPLHATPAGAFASLPAWAQATLRAHAADSRTVHSWERLASGRAGEALWDLAQRSLVVHGELHNNLRMTWGKAIVGWTRSPEEAVTMLFDLNNRFALDGADPASYGGLLWCVGLFDRAFAPEQPVFGTVRTRPIDAHAARLDLDAYARIVHRRTRPWRVAVIGAGIAGAACARTLAEHGVEVVVFEKSRGAGGRMSTRRGEAGEFDHGAQYFTARDTRFAQRVSSWIDDGVVAEWRARFAAVRAGCVEVLAPPPRFVAVPRMNALCAWLLAGPGVVLRTESAVASIARTGRRWALSIGAESDEFDVVLSTAPAAQTAALLREAAPGLAACATREVMRPVWALMWASRGRVELPFDHAEIEHGALAWVSRVSSKPGRAQDGVDRWVVLAKDAWSEVHLEETPDAIAPRLAQAFAELSASLGVTAPEPHHALAHRWRFALASLGAGGGALFDADLGIGLAGDWRRGTRVEDAYLSGVALAGRALGEWPHAVRAP